MLKIRVGVSVVLLVCMAIAVYAKITHPFMSSVCVGVLTGFSLCAVWSRK